MELSPSSITPSDTSINKLVVDGAPAASKPIGYPEAAPSTHSVYVQQRTMPGHLVRCSALAQVVRERAEGTSHRQQQQPAERCQYHPCWCHQGLDGDDVAGDLAGMRVL